MQPGNRQVYYEHSREDKYVHCTVVKQYKLGGALCPVLHCPQGPYA